MALESLTLEEKRLALRIALILRDHKLEDYIKVEVVRQGAQPVKVGYQIGPRTL